MSIQLRYMKFDTHMQDMLIWDVKKFHLDWMPNIRTTGKRMSLGPVRPPLAQIRVKIVNVCAQDSSAVGVSRQVVRVLRSPEIWRNKKDRRVLLCVAWERWSSLKLEGKEREVYTLRLSSWFFGTRYGVRTIVSKCPWCVPYGQGKKIFLKPRKK